MLPWIHNKEREVLKVELSTMVLAIVSHSTGQLLHDVRQSNLARPQGVDRDRLNKNEKHLISCKSSACA